MNAIELRHGEVKKLSASFRERSAGEMQVKNVRWHTSSIELVLLEPQSDGSCLVRAVGPLGECTVSALGELNGKTIGHGCTIQVCTDAVRGGITATVVDVPAG